MEKIVFKFKKNYRTFKEGEIIELKLHHILPNFIVGQNMCGKSTLLQALRSQKDSLRDVNKDLFDGMETGQISLAKSEVPNVMDIEGFDFDYAFYLDSIIDDPVSFENSATAAALCMGGGLHALRQSKGEKSLIMLTRFIKNIEKFFEKKGTTAIDEVKNGKKILIVLDEVDEGLDIKLQLNYQNILINKFSIEMFATVIAVTHNPLCIAENSDWDKVYDVGTRSYKTGKEYIKERTGYEIIVKKIEDERKADKHGD